MPTNVNVLMLPRTLVSSLIYDQRYAYLHGGAAAWNNHAQLIQTKPSDGIAGIWTGTATIWTEPLPFGLNGAFGGRLRRSEPSPARRAPSAQ